MKRVARIISSKEDVEFLLNITEEQGSNLSFMMENFGMFGDKPPRFFPYDILNVPPDSYGAEGKRNKNSFTTTAGIWVFNKVFIEKELFDLFGYINQPINKKTFGAINKKLSFAVLEDRISLDAMKNYITKTQKFQPYCTLLAPSCTTACMEIPSKIRKRKQELFNKYKKELDANDPVISSKIEKELLDECKEILKDDEFMDLIRSGARISFDNNFKNMYVFRGAVKEPDPTMRDYTVIRSNYMEGISKEDYSDFANSLTGGPYSRAINTAKGGALEKYQVKALQHLIALPEGTDCGTNRTITIKLTKKNIEDWIYSYMVENGKLVELTSENMDKYIDKTVKLRYSGYCESKKGICSKCSGHLFNRVGLSEVGIASFQIMSTIKNISMKAFHDSIIRITNIETDYGLNKVFGLEG